MTESKLLSSDQGSSILEVLVALSILLLLGGALSNQYVGIQKLQHRLLRKELRLKITEEQINILKSDSSLSAFAANNQQRTITVKTRCSMEFPRVCQAISNDRDKFYEEIPFVVWNNNEN
ncbi:MAG: hypothetical protein R3B52_03630 [Candidatus Paceibacterota bacterium]